MSTPTDVVVVGGGLIGLASAWRIAQQGHRVSVVDPAPASAASRAAAGMLAPVTEVQYGEERLLSLAVASLLRYPDFAAELEDATGIDVGLRRTGTLLVATDAGDRALLTDLHAFQQRLGLRAELLTSRECRQLEPMLTPGARSALFVEGDHSVDNRRLAAALLAAAHAAGVDVVTDRVERIVVENDRARGVALTDRTIDAGAVLLAAGPWSATIPGVPEPARPPVRPVKGQILRLRGPVLLSRTVRAFVAGAHVYLVPRADGELVVGATMEELGFDTTIRAGAVYDLLRDAHAVVPGIAELELAETTAALRPGSPDNAPMIGATAVDGLYAATGHHRNGVLLTPVTADLVATAVVGAGTDDEGWLTAFSPLRFDPAHQTAAHQKATPEDPAHGTAVPTSAALT